MNSATLNFYLGTPAQYIALRHQRGELLRALHEWAKYVDITWIETTTPDVPRCVELSFEPQSHGDGSDFDGVGGELAHASYEYPWSNEPIAGDVHFDRAEFWQAHHLQGKNLYPAALHEIGHALGLPHNDNPDSIMYPSLYSRTNLTQVDIDNIRQLYATRAADSTAPTVTLTNPASNASASSLPSVNGSVNDSGSGVAIVKFYLYRVSDDKYWTGAATETTFIKSWLTADPGYEPFLDGTVNGNSWSVTDNLPGGVLLPDGEYQLGVTAIDRAGNATTIGQTFYVDSTLPAVNVTTPAPLGAVKSLSGGIGGTSSDSTGLIKTTVELFRPASGGGFEYWNGSAWAASSTSTVFTITHTGNPTAVSWLASQGKNGQNVSFSVPTLVAPDDDDIYRVRAKAYDANSNIAVVTTTFAVDNGTPAVAVTTPSSTVPVKDLTGGLGGTASDANGLNKVTVELFRSTSTPGVYQYWNGSSWISTTTVFTISFINGPTSFNWNTWQNPAIVLPDGTDLPEENLYRVRAKAYDRAGNITTVTTVFSVEKVPPTVAVTTPAPSGAVKTLSAGLGGTASDANGLDKVTVELFRSTGTTGVYQYWNGTTWVGIIHPFTLTFANGPTSVNWNTLQNSAIVLPTGLADGNIYWVRAKAYDRPGNVATVTTQFAVDNSAPTVTITNPVNAPTRATIGPVTGTASDSVGGLNYVSILVSRPATGGGYEYWNGTSWGASGTLPPLTPGSPSGTFNWSVPIGQLPTGANLPDGNYYVRAIAYDRAGNTASTATQLVIIDADGS